VRRRDFIKAIAGSTVWPFAARAQQAAIPVIGFLGTASAAPFAHYLAGFRQGLRETGHVEGDNVAIEFRWAEGHYDRVPALAADLAQRQVAVIVTVGGELSALAAKAATTTIPIVFNSGGDPVKAGLVASLARPGGNATGVKSANSIDLSSKALYQSAPARSTRSVCTASSVRWRSGHRATPLSSRCTIFLLVPVPTPLVSRRTIQRFDRSRSATRRAIAADASSGIGNTELTLISPST